MAKSDFDIQGYIIYIIRSYVFKEKEPLIKDL